MNFRRYTKYKRIDLPSIKEIPYHWDIWKLRHGIKTIGSGTTPQSDNTEYYNGKILWVNTSELRETIITDTEKKITELAISDYPILRHYKKNSIVIALYGATIGRLGILGKNATVNQACCVFDDLEKFNYKFLFYWFLMYRPILISLSYGGGQPNLSQDILKQIKVPMPEIEEQINISNFLDYHTEQIDQLISQKEKLIELLEEKRIALITKAVTKGINPKVKYKDSGDKWLGEIPEHWKVKRMKYVVKIQFSGVDKKSIENEKDVLLCNYVDVYKNEYITPSIEFMRATATKKEIKKYTIDEGDILVTKDSETPYDIAVPALVTMDFKNVICGYHLAQIKSELKTVVPKYLFRLFQAKNFNAQFVVSANGITRYGLGTYVFGDAGIPILTIQEQEQIVKYIDNACSNIDEISQLTKKAISKLKEYRSALITAAVTGRIDVRDFENKNYYGDGI